MTGIAVCHPIAEGPQSTQASHAAADFAPPESGMVASRRSAAPLSRRECRRRVVRGLAP